MDNSKTVNGASVEGQDLDGFKMVEKDLPKRIYELTKPLIGAYKGKSKSTHSALYTIETQDGVVRLIGCTDLDSQMSKVEIGTMVKIVYEGEFKTKAGHFMSRCQVFTK